MGQLEKAKKGDRDAFVDLLKEYQGLLYHTAMMLLKNEEDALDAVQDTVLACWETLPTLRQNRYFKTWLTRILLNKCYDCLRERAHFSGGELPETGTEPDWDLSMDMSRSMGQLSETDSLMLSLFYYDGFTTREIARLLSISENAVRTRLNRSRNRLKRIIEKEETQSL